MLIPAHPPAAAADAAAVVDEERQWRRLMTMATYGGFGGTGVNRAAFSAEDIAARLTPVPPNPP